LSENFFQCGLANGLLAFWSNADLASSGIIADIPAVFEVLDRVADAGIVGGQPILPVQLIQPDKRLRRIARRMLVQLQKKFQQLVEAALGQGVGDVFRKMKTTHNAKSKVRVLSLKSIQGGVIFSIRNQKQFPYLS